MADLDIMMQLLRHVMTSPHDEDLKGDSFRPINYSPILYVIAFILSELWRGGRAESAPPPLPAPIINFDRNAPWS